MYQLIPVFLLHNILDDRKELIFRYGDCGWVLFNYREWEAVGEVCFSVLPHSCCHHFRFREAEGRADPSLSKAGVTKMQIFL